MDASYRVGALAQCDQPLCCRNLPVESSQTITEPSTLAGRFGDLRNCDMPIETIESLVDDAFNFTEKVFFFHPNHVWISIAERTLL